LKFLLLFVVITDNVVNVSTTTSSTSLTECIINDLKGGWISVFCSCVQDGGVREHGTHSELLSMRGHYYRLVEAQKSCGDDIGYVEALNSKSSLI
jgi:hypothetical protein